MNPSNKEQMKTITIPIGQADDLLYILREVLEEKAATLEGMYIVLSQYPTTKDIDIAAGVPQGFPELSLKVDRAEAEIATLLTTIRQLEGK